MSSPSESLGLRVIWGTLTQRPCSKSVLLGEIYGICDVHRAFKKSFTNIHFTPWLSGSVGWNVVPHTKRSGHIPRLQVQSLIKSAYGRQLINVSLSHQCFFPPSSVSKNIIIIIIIIRRRSSFSNLINTRREYPYLSQIQVSAGLCFF